MSDTTLALTQAELGIWLGHQRAADPSVYNAAEGILLSGAINVDAFERALRETLREAASLRVELVERDGEPRRRESSRDAPEPKRRDLRGLSDPLLVAQSDVMSALGRPFDIARGELYEHRLYRLAESQLLWVHIAHHVALDGYGFNLLTRRVAERYAALEKGRETSTAFDGVEPVLREDRAYQGSDARKHDREFWRRELDGTREVALGHHLKQSAHGRRVARRLNDTEQQALRDLAKAAGVEWTEACLALVATLVHRSSREPAFALGLPVMLRFGSAALKVPCMAMNIVSLPVRFTPGITFAELAQQVRATLARARPHLRYRYEHLASDLGPGRRPFGPVVNLIPFEAPRRFGSCSAEAIGFSAGPVEDVAVTFRQSRGSLELIVDGHPDAGDEAWLSGWLGELQTTLTSLAAEPSSPLFRAPTSPVPLSAHIATQAGLRPEAIALEDGERRWTYRELDAAARRGAAALCARGVKPGSVVAIDGARSASSWLLVLASLYAGAGYAALDPHHPGARRRQFLQLLQPSICVTPTELEAWLSDDALCEAGRLPVSPHDPAYLVFTSGSTGEPKGVVVGHGALSHFMEAALPTYGIHAGDRVLQFAALTFDASVEEAALTWAAGATLVLRDDAMLESLSAFTEASRARGITVWDLPTAFWHELCLALREGVASVPEAVRLVIVGGEAVSAERLQEWRNHGHGRLLNTYGPSEATIVATVADLSTWQPGQPVPIGRALPGVTALLLDENRETIQDPQTVGELCLLGPTLAEGYHRRADLSAERFINLVGYGRGYLTGDVAQWSKDGQLLFVGRRDDELKISGQRIAPAEIEATLGAHPAVRACVVQGERNASGALHLVAHVETSTELNPQELRQFLAARLPATMIPTVFERHDSLPITRHGKLDRIALRPAAHPRRSTPEASTLLALVQNAWQEVLGLLPGPNDDFFALGGSSLQVIQLANRLSRHGRALKVASIFRHPTPAQQAALLDGAAVEARTELLPLSLPEACLAPRQAPQSDAVLLTGATGFVGIYLLRALLERTASDITALVRAPSDDLAIARLLSVARDYGWDLAQYRERVRAVALRDEALRSLPTHGAVLHAAAEVSLTRDYRSLFDSNVLLVRELLGLAATWGASFHQVSSIAAVPERPHEAERRETFDEAWHGPSDGYRLTKWQAERLCVMAGERGLPVAVYRLGRVAAATTEPRINAKDLVWQIARASALVGSWPALNVAEPWLAVDVAARHVIGLMRSGSARTPAQAYHLTHGGDVVLDDVRIALTDAGVALPVVPMEEWLRRLRENGSPQALAMAAFFELQAAAEAPGATSWSWQHVAELLGPDCQAAALTTPTRLHEHARAALAQGVVGSVVGR